jgi:hypothetical protein
MIVIFLAAAGAVATGPVAIRGAAPAAACANTGVGPNRRIAARSAPLAAAVLLGNEQRRSFFLLHILARHFRASVPGDDHERQLISKFVSKQAH